MGIKPSVGGRAGSILKNSSLGFLTNVLPSVLRLFSRYVFLMYFGDTLLGVNSLFTDVVAIFSFAEIGIYAAISFFLYKPIAEGDTDTIQSLLALFRKLNRYIMLAVTVVGLGFIPFLGYIKTDEPIPGLLIYYLIFLAQNLLSYLYSYRMAYLTAAQKAYRLAPINLTIAFLTEAFQIIVTITTRNFVAYLLTYAAMLAARILLSNRLIVKNCPETCFRKTKPLDQEIVRQFVKKTKSLFILKVMELGISQTDSVIVSTMVDVTQWGYVSNYVAIKKMTALVMSALSFGLVPSLGNLNVVESKEKQEDSFRLYSFCNSLLCLNIFTCLVVLVPPFIELVFGQRRVLDDMTCFLLYLNVLYSGLLEPVAVLRDARGLYEKDKWINVACFVTNMIMSILFVRLLGLPGVFLGTLCCTTVAYYRMYMVVRMTFGREERYYFVQAAKTLLLGLVAYAALHWLIYPAIWQGMQNVLGLILCGAATVVATNLLFWAAYGRDPYFSRTLQLMRRFLPAKKA